LNYAIHSMHGIVNGVVTPGTAYHTAQTCKVHDGLDTACGYPITSASAATEINRHQEVLLTEL